MSVLKSMYAAASGLLAHSEAISVASDNIANVNTVAGIDSNVTTVAGISANVRLDEFCHRFRLKSPANPSIDVSSSTLKA